MNDYEITSQEELQLLLLAEREGIHLLMRSHRIV